MSKRLCSSMLANITHSWGRYLQVQLLLDHIKAIETELRVSREDEERAAALYGEEARKVDRLTGNVALLHAEKQAIENQVKAFYGPVTLPIEIAAAIEELKNTGYTVDEMAWLIAHGDDPTAAKEELTLHNYAVKPGAFLQLVNALQFGYTVEHREKSPDDHVFEQYIQFCDNGMVEAAEAMLKAIELLAPGKTELLDKMRAVERLPF